MNTAPAPVTLRSLLTSHAACPDGVAAVGAVLDLDAPSPPLTAWTLGALAADPAVRLFVGWAVGRIVPVVALDVRYLQGADLQGAYLRYADLRGANLRGADLQGAYLWGANLQGANLRYADLRYADLRYADLRYADLQGANLTGQVGAAVTRACVVRGDVVVVSPYPERTDRVLVTVRVANCNAVRAGVLVAAAVPPDVAPAVGADVAVTWTDVVVDGRPFLAASLVSA